MATILSAMQSLLLCYDWIFSSDRLLSECYEDEDVRLSFIGLPTDLVHILRLSKIDRLW